VGLLPLAVRVCGLKLAVLRHMPLGDYAARLTDPARILDELAVGDLVVRARLSAAWSDLTPPNRHVLYRLAALPLGAVFTLGGAAAVLGCDEDRALRDLESLITAGALGSPFGEVSAHAALYEFSPLTQVLAREAASSEPTPDDAVPLTDC
jgi:hypothetical protein